MTRTRSFLRGLLLLAAALLLTAYPAWDSAANLIDAGRSGGLRHNRTQALNAAVSAAAGPASRPARARRIVWLPVNPPPLI